MSDVRGCYHDPDLQTYLARQRARFLFCSSGCRASVAAAARVLAGSLLQEWRQQAGSHTATHVLLRGSQSKFRSVARRQPVGSGSAAKAGQPVNWLPSHFSPAAGRLQPSGSHSFFAVRYWSRPGKLQSSIVASVCWQALLTTLCDPVRGPSLATTIGG